MVDVSFIANYPVFILSPKLVMIDFRIFLSNVRYFGSVLFADTSVHWYLIILIMVRNQVMVNFFDNDDRNLTVSYQVICSFRGCSYRSV